MADAEALGGTVLEPNGTLADGCTTVPRVLVCVAPVEKVVPRLTDLGVLLPLLTRSAASQPATRAAAKACRTTGLSGLRRKG